MKALIYKFINKRNLWLSAGVCFVILIVLISGLSLPGITQASQTKSGLSPGINTGPEALNHAIWYTLIIAASVLVIQLFYFTRQFRNPDTDELQKVHEDLQRKNTLLEAAESLSKSAGWELQVATGQVYWTNNMYSLHGVDENFIPSLDLPFYTEKSRHALRNHIRAAINQQIPCLTDLELHRVDGKSAWVRWSIIPVEENGTVSRLQGAVINVTSEKESETEFFQVKKDIEKSNLDMSRILKVVAHDLRSPINSIIGLASLITPNEKLSTDDREILQLISESSERAKRLINEIMTMTSIDDEMEINATLTDVRTLLIKLVRQLQFAASEKNLFIQVDSPKSIMAYIDADKITRAINNIVSNAIKFSPSGKSIRIRLYATVHRLIISVNDSGIGIPSELKEHIFDMFTPAKRLGTSGEKPFGLGLHISKKIVESHDGRLWLESEDGMGSTFHLELPIRQRSETNRNEVTQVA